GNTMVGTGIPTVTWPPTWTPGTGTPTRAPAEAHRPVPGTQSARAGAETKVARAREPRAEAKRCMSGRLASSAPQGNAGNFPDSGRVLRRLLRSFGVTEVRTFVSCCAGPVRRRPAGPILPAMVDKLTLSEEQWRARLTPEAFQVLRRQGTERAW